VSAGDGIVDDQGEAEADEGEVRRHRGPTDDALRHPRGQPRQAEEAAVVVLLRRRDVGLSGRRGLGLGRLNEPLGLKRVQEVLDIRCLAVLLAVELRCLADGSAVVEPVQDVEPFGWDLEDELAVGVTDVHPVAVALM
jgi:hypothetical protein